MRPFSGRKKDDSAAISVAITDGGTAGGAQARNLPRGFNRLVSNRCHDVPLPPLGSCTDSSAVGRLWSARGPLRRSTGALCALYLRTVHAATERRRARSAAARRARPRGLSLRGEHRRDRRSFSSILGKNGENREDGAQAHKRAGAAANWHYFFAWTVCQCALLLVGHGSFLLHVRRQAWREVLDLKSANAKN